MELRHLHAFVTVAELLSFRRAARQLHLSQPPLTRQIQALEEELGARLLERGSRRQIALTEVGRLFLADAKQALCLVEGARKRVHDYTCRGRNRLVIANYSLLSVWLLPECLRAFRSRCPQVEIFTLEMNGTENCAALGEGRVHLGLIADHGLAVDGGLRSEVLLTVPLIAVFSTDHPLARTRAPELDVDALAGENILFKQPDYVPCYTQRLPELFERAGVAPRVLRAVEGMPNVLALASAGYGVAVLPGVFKDHLDPGLCSKRLRLPASMPALQLFMVWRPRNMPAPLQAFLEVARGVAAGQDGARPPQRDGTHLKLTRRGSTEPDGGVRPRANGSRRMERKAAALSVG